MWRCVLQAEYSKVQAVEGNIISEQSVKIFLLSIYSVFDAVY